MERCRLPTPYGQTEEKVEIPSYVHWSRLLNTIGSDTNVIPFLINLTRNGNLIWGIL